MSLRFIDQAFPRVLKGGHWETGMKEHDVSCESHPVCVDHASPSYQPHQAEGSVCSVCPMARMGAEAAVMKGFSGKLQNHVRENAFNVSKSCMGFYFCLLHTPELFWAN